MDSYAQQSMQADAQKQAADDKMWSGVSSGISAAGGLSDKRAKENSLSRQYSFKFLMSVFRT